MLDSKRTKFLLVLADNLTGFTVFQLPTLVMASESDSTDQRSGQARKVRAVKKSLADLPTIVETSIPASHWLLLGYRF
jgi:hypothetical protein